MSIYWNFSIPGLRVLNPAISGLAGIPGFGIAILFVSVYECRPPARDTLTTLTFTALITMQLTDLLGVY